jgi:hypothetical protein
MERGPSRGRGRGLGGLEVADLREGEESLSDLWLRCRSGSHVPFVYDFRLHG